MGSKKKKKTPKPPQIIAPTELGEIDSQEAQRASLILQQDSGGVESTMLDSPVKPLGTIMSEEAKKKKKKENETMLGGY